MSLLSQIKQKPVLSQSTSTIQSSTERVSVTTHGGRQSPTATARAAPEMIRATVGATSIASSKISNSDSIVAPVPAPPISLLSSIKGFDKTKALKKSSALPSTSTSKEGVKAKIMGNKENSNGGGNPMALAAAAAKKLKHISVPTSTVSSTSSVLGSKSGGGGVAPKVAAVAIAARAAVSSSSPSLAVGQSVLRSSTSSQQSTNSSISTTKTVFATPLRKTGRALV